MPQLLSMVQSTTITPFMAIVTSGFIAILMMIPSDFNQLVNYFSFASWLVYGATALGVITLRITDKDAIRPIKIPIPIPCIVVLSSVYLIAAPIINNPSVEFIYVIIFLILGIVMYFPVVRFKYQPRFMDSVTVFFQLLFDVAPPKGANEDERKE
ncbi:b(0,+)-type amino acid transporter 1-like [Amphiura filiformis]|uniref:b(0,+)-type amino acid transporter 1-like n=1 Tax=Amphiura filiformis TaxID=82378 RepID=UPI003B2267FD